MSEIQTIDQRIRADARKKLKKEIQESANEFMRAINIIGTTDKVTIKTKNNDNYFIEMNPRFGGGVPLSIAAGANFPKALIYEFLGYKKRILWKI